MKHYRTCNICEALCGLVIEHDGEKVLKIRGNEHDPLSRGHICPKAYGLKDIHEDPDRLRRPVRRVDGEWVETTWEEAWDAIAERVVSIQERHGPNSIGIYSGNPTAHSYSAILAAMPFYLSIGTHNRFSATSCDQLPHMFAALELFGGQVVFPVPDIDRTDMMVIIGGNPAVSNGSIMTAPGVNERLQKIRKRGGRVVVIDPRRTETARLADEHLFITPGTDAALLLAIIDVLFCEDLIDEGPWRDYVDGLPMLAATARRFPAARVAEATGIDAETIHRLAREIATADSAIVYGRLGTSTQEFGGLAAWLLYAINIITGNFDRPGGIMFGRPAVDLAAVAGLLGQKGHFGRRHSRVNGRPEFNDEFPASEIATEIDTPGEGRIRMMFTIAGNPVLSTPDGKRLAAALDGLESMVSFDMYVTATSSHAEWILPPPSPLERDHYGLVFHALGVRNTAKYSQPLFAAEPDSKEDWQNLLGIAAAINRRRRTLKGRVSAAALDRLSSLGAARLLDLALRCGPYGSFRRGHENDLSLSTLISAPHGIDFGPLESRAADAIQTKDGRIDVAPDVYQGDIPRLEKSLARDTGPHLKLIGRRTLRSNNTWLHNSRRLTKGKPGCTLLMNPKDARSRSIKNNDLVRVSSRTGSVDVTVTLTRDIMPGVVSMPHGWGHADKGAKLAVANTTGGASINDLTDASFHDSLTGTSALSGVPVNVHTVRA